VVTEQIEATVGLLADGSVLAAVENVVGPLDTGRWKR